MNMTSEELKIREEQAQEAIMDSTDMPVESTSEYDALWGAMADPSINDEMTEYILKKLDKSKDEMLDIFKKARKSCEPSKTADSKQRFQIALNNSLGAMKVSKRFMKGMDFSTLSREEIRSIISQYYSIQSSRIAITNQIKAAERMGNDCTMLSYIAEQLRISETNIKTYIDAFTDKHPICVWMKSITGIGPIIAAGLVAYFDITRTKTAGGFWSYVGWTGVESSRKKGEKLNYNPKARVLCWKAASSFKMRCNDPKCFYGILYNKKKEYYKENNENGMYKDTAKKILENANYRDGTSTKDAYEQGKLSDAHIDARAMRFSAKIFLSHLFDIWYMYENGEYPPVPFAKAQLGHVHIDAIPNFDIIKPVLDAKYPDKVWDVSKIYSRGV